MVLLIQAWLINIFLNGSQTCLKMYKGEKSFRWGTVDNFLHFQPLLLYFMSKQAQNLSHNKTTLYTQHHAKT